MPSGLPFDPNWSDKGAQRKKVERNNGGRRREEEWKEELQRREGKMLGKMNAKMEAFYKNEAKMLKKIEGFKYLYREQFKEFEKLMKDRYQ